jgi:hypothetical protein
MNLANWQMATDGDMSCLFESSWRDQCRIECDSARSRSSEITIDHVRPESFLK